MKAKNVELIKNYNKWFGLKYDIAYFYNVYGKNHIKTGKYATVIGIFENALENNEPIPVIGDGTQERDFTHIDDIVSGLCKIEENSKGECEYFLGTGKNHKIITVAKMFSNNIKHLPKKEGERQSSIIPSQENNDKIEWKSQIKLNEYIKEWKESETF
jgi:UDP-glucose 4-epimerase